MTKSKLIIDTKPAKYWTVDRILILCSFCSVQFCAFMCFAILAPFFPSEAKKRGVSETVAGLIFATMSFVQFLVSPFIGKVLPLVGAKFMYMAGMASASFCVILFGTLEYSPHGVTFATLCFVIRAVMAVSVSAYATAAYSLLMKQFAGNLGMVLGLVQTFVGLGLTLGPAIGGALYAWGGFQLPFYTTGGFMFLFVFVNYYILTKVVDSKETTTGSFKQLFKVRGLWWITISVMLSGQVWTTIDPILEPRVKESVYGLQPSEVGLLFLLMSGMYAIFAPLVGKITDRVKDLTLCIPLGLLVCGLSLVMLGPCRYVFADDFRPLWLVLVSLGVLGIADSFVIVPSYTSLLTRSLESGMENDVMTYSLVSGWWRSAFCFGDFLGPSLGAYLVDELGFEDGLLIVGGACVIIALTILLYITIAMCLGEPRGYERLDDDFDNEQLPLMKASEVRTSYDKLTTL